MDSFFTPERLVLHKADWILLLANNEDKLTDSDRRWLSAWNAQASGIPISFLGLCRLWHYTGYHDNKVGV